MKKPAKTTDFKLIPELRSAIADDGRTPYALARDSGVDESSIRRFVSRERTISLESADRLSCALGLTLVRKSRPKKVARPVEPSSDDSIA